MGSHATAKNESTIAIGNGAKVGATNGNVAATNGIAIGTKSESKDQQLLPLVNKQLQQVITLLPWGMKLRQLEMRGLPLVIQQVHLTSL